MPLYEFTLVVEGIRVDDPEHAALLSGAGAADALLFEQGGITYLAFHRDAESGIAAVTSALGAVQSAYRSAEVVAIDFDLVAISEIAIRLGLSREAVRLYVEGKRRSQSSPFPRHIGVVGKGQRVWPWAVVHEWASSASVEVALDYAAQPVPFQEVLLLQARLAAAGKPMQRPESAEEQQAVASKATEQGRGDPPDATQGGRTEWQQLGRFMTGSPTPQRQSSEEPHSPAGARSRDRDALVRRSNPRQEHDQ